MELSLEEVLAALRGSGSKGLKVKDLARKLGARSKDTKALRSLVEELEAQGRIVRGRRKRYKVPGEAGCVTGKLVGYGVEAAILFPIDGSPGIKVPGESLSGAAHGDTVLARLRQAEDGSPVAEVVKIVDRCEKAMIGQLSGWRERPGVGPYYGRTRRGRPAGSAEKCSVTVGQEAAQKSVSVGEGVTARPGDYVVVRVHEWGAPYESARGRITEVLGGPSTAGEDFAAIAKEFNLPLSFPQAVLEEAGAIPDAVPKPELARRRDLSKLLTFTIDPDDAKDFDDAISLEPLGGGAVRVGVHIADVDYYVREGSALDREALARARSVYLVDRVVPMLPANLSSNLAALVAKEPRLAVSVVMDVGRRGEVTSYWIGETHIRSAARLTYDEAQAMLDKGPGPRCSAEVKSIGEALKRANDLRQLLRDKRIKRGAIELETPELQVVVDGEGNAVDVRRVRRDQSHSLIEELMILANETVAGHMSYLGRRFMYRVHEVPDEDRMKDLGLFAATFGHRFRWSKGTSPAALQALLGRVKGTPEEYLVSMFLLRSMKKAQYSERNVGHFGLASECYTHFTSPIRRYPDLVVHRLLKTYGLKRLEPEDGDALGEFVHRAAEISSVREVEGDNAERAFTKAKVAEFMEQRLGEEYWGIISGVKDFGLFVMLEDNLVEGLVHVSRLGDDYYKLDATGVMLVGTRGRGFYRMGDRVRVKVVSADRARREVDFIITAREKREGSELKVEESMSRSQIRKVYGELRQEIERSRSGGRRRGGLRPARGGRGRRGRTTQQRSSKPARLRRMKRAGRRR
ncbi:MAG: ribonuclease R [bacterium]